LEEHAWVEECPAEITVCDAAGTLTEMNEAAGAIFADDGGRGLLGSDVLDCHTGADRIKMEELLARPQVNTYINEAKGTRTFFYHAPWYQDARFAGYVEISFDLPAEIPHFIRK
jgi:hypothetical protein